MTFEQATALRDTFNRLVDETSATLRAIPGVGSGPMGLTPDAVKFSPEFRAADLAFKYAFANLRAFNDRYTKEFKKEVRAARRAKYAPAPCV